MATKNGKQKIEVRSKRRPTEDRYDVADWGAVDGDKLGKFIAKVTKGGAAVRFGYTRDGGTYAVGFYDQGDSWTEYCPSPSSVEQWLAELWDRWDD